MQAPPRETGQAPAKRGGNRKNTQAVMRDDLKLAALRSTTAMPAEQWCSLEQRVPASVNLREQDMAETAPPQS